jgi:hypothetical protein
MKPTLGGKPARSKPPSMYQDYRSRTKSELDCSELLSGISELDNQMSKYDELRKQRLSQSMIFDSEEQCQNLRSSLRLEERPSYDAELTADDNLLYAPLVPIVEFQKAKLSSKPAPGSITSKSVVEAKFNKEKAQTASMKLEESRLREERREKANLLKVKTKQLQQEFLQLYGNDILKKSAIAKEFGLLLKLL